jgi:hypothetical protein
MKKIMFLICKVFLNIIEDPEPLVMISLLTKM